MHCFYFLSFVSIIIILTIIIVIIMNRLNKYEDSPKGILRYIRTNRFARIALTRKCPTYIDRCKRVSDWPVSDKSITLIDKTNFRFGFSDGPSVCVRRPRALNVDVELNIFPNKIIREKWNTYAIVYFMCFPNSSVIIWHRSTNNVPCQNCQAPFASTFSSNKVNFQRYQLPSFSTINYYHYTNKASFAFEFEWRFYALSIGI